MTVKDSASHMPRFQNAGSHMEDCPSDDDWGVESPPKRKVLRFHYHSQ